MFAWLIGNLRVILPIMGSAIFFTLGYIWTFILMGYKTEARVGDLENKYHAQQAQISTVDRQTAELIGIMKSVKEDTSTLKSALIKDALDRKGTP